MRVFCGSKSLKKIKDGLVTIFYELAVPFFGFSRILGSIINVSTFYGENYSALNFFLHLFLRFLFI